MISQTADGALFPRRPQTITEPCGTLPQLHPRARPDHPGVYGIQLLEPCAWPLRNLRNHCLNLCWPAPDGTGTFEYVFGLHLEPYTWPAPDHPEILSGLRPPSFQLLGNKPNEDLEKKKKEGKKEEAKISVPTKTLGDPGLCNPLLMGYSCWDWLQSQLTTLWLRKIPTLRSLLSLQGIAA